MGLKAFPWSQVEKLIETEKNQGVRISLYIDDGWLNEYKPTLTERGFAFLGTDTYVYRELDQAYPVKDGVTIVPLNEALMNDYVNVAKKCFGEWPNEEQCARFTAKLTKSADNRRYNQTALVMNQAREVVAFGSILNDLDGKLGYIHNTGTREDYRRKGLFTEMVKYLSNIAFAENIKTVLAIVEKDQASYHGFMKMGYHQSPLYHLYSKGK